MALPNQVLYRVHKFFLLLSMTFLGMSFIQYCTNIECWERANVKLVWGAEKERKNIDGIEFKFYVFEMPAN